MSGWAPLIKMLIDLGIIRTIDLGSEFIKCNETLNNNLGNVYTPSVWIKNLNLVFVASAADN